jgi:hypothetical protein
MSDRDDKKLKLSFIYNVQKAIVHLTPLGIESQKDMQKYVMLETRRLLYFDGFLLKPLLQDHYESRSMRFLSEQEEAAKGT